MIDPFLVHEPYVRGEVQIEAPISADWARTLDSHKIRWTYEASSNPCFHLTELNQILEIGDFGADANEVQRERLGDFTGTLVLQGHLHGNFRFRDLVVPVQNDLLVHCHECDNAFFSPSLDLLCGFCGAPKPFVLHYRRSPPLGRRKRFAVLCGT